MKKIWLMLAMILSMTGLLCSMTACGNKETEQDDDHSSQQETADQEETQDDHAGQEYVYQVSEQELETKITNFSGMCEWEDRIYIAGTCYETDENTGEYGTHFYLLECSTDGKKENETELACNEDEMIRSMAVYDNQLHILTAETDEDGNQSYSVKILGQNGKLKKDHDLVMEDGVSLWGNSVMTGDGSVYGMDMNHVYYFDAEGKQKKAYDLKAYLDTLAVTGEGDIYAYGMLGDDNSYAMKKLDGKTEKFGEAVELDYSASNVNACGGSSGIIYLQDTQNLYQVDAEQGKEEIVLNWINNDVDGDEIQCFLPLQQDGGFLAVSKSLDNTSESADILMIKKVPASDVKEKKVLTLACIKAWGDLKDSILEFNKQNEDYRIEVKDYSSYDDFRTKLNLDIVSGEVPDILILQDLPVDMYIKKGILTDLYPLMDADSEISRDDFLDSFLQTLEQDGKLYYMGNSFLIDTWCVGKNYLGTKDWTFETMKELYKNQSKQQVFLYNIDRESFLREMILGGIDNFVNWETGEVSIDSDEFMDILELSTYIPSNEDTDIEEVDLKKTIKKGNLIAMECSLYQCSDIELFSQFYKKAGGAEIAGYPSKNSGNAISIRFFNPAMAITQQCEDKEGAWEFLRYFLTFEKQLSYATGENDVGFPVRKDAFEKMLEYAMAKESYTDENGVEITPIDSSYNYYGCEIPIGPISEEEADQIRDVVDRIGTVTTENDVVSTQIMDIVQEEAGAFYAGDKTAKEVAEIIQSRIKLFVSENS